MNSKQRRRIERQWKYTVTWTAPPDDNYDDDDYPIEVCFTGNMVE